MIELKQTNKNLALTDKKFLKGDDGGYYIPTIDAEGNLTWRPTVADMSIPDAANIRGPVGKTGATGKSGVHVGSNEPAADVFVWIDPAGEGDVDLTAYYTKEEVGELLANLPSEVRVKELINEALGVIENGTY